MGAVAVGLFGTVCPVEPTDREGAPVPTDRTDRPLGTDRTDRTDRPLGNAQAWDADCLSF